MTDVVTEMPRSRSTFIQSLRARRRSPRALTAPASWIAPPNSSSFSVSVVLPASGWAMIANVRRLAICAGYSDVDMTAQSTVRAAAAQLATLAVPLPGWQEFRGVESQPSASCWSSLTSRPALPPTWLSYTLAALGGRTGGVRGARWSGCMANGELVAEQRPAHVILG